MANALLDFGGNDGVGFYAGVGAGRAMMKTRMLPVDGNINSPSVFINDRDSAWAWQALAGIRVPLNDWIEVGAKYKYIDTH